MKKQNSLPEVKPLSNEWFTLKFLKEWTADDIDLAISKDVDLERLIIEHPDDAKALKTQASLFDSSWTVGDILYWFSVRRPDLYKRLATEDGIQWILNHYKKRTRMKRTLSSI